MSGYWKFWFLSGTLGQYVDIDYNFWVIRGYLHIQYGPMSSSENKAHR